MTHRSASRASLRAPAAPGKRGLPATFPWHLFSRPTPFAVGRKLASFSCSIPPLFVLSHSMPMTNTTGKLASFWRFSLTTGSLPSGSLATGHCSFAPRRHPPHQRGQVVRRSSPAGYCLTPTADLSKTERGPISTNDSSIFQYVTEPGDSCGKINPFLLLLSLISRNSPKQLGMVSPELLCRP